LSCPFNGIIRGLCFLLSCPFNPHGQTSSESKTFDQSLNAASIGSERPCKREILIGRTNAEPIEVAVKTTKAFYSDLNNVPIVYRGDFNLNVFNLEVFVFLCNFFLPHVHLQRKKYPLSWDPSTTGFNFVCGKFFFLKSIPETRTQTSK
jgi:hypothetical protein